MSDTKYKIALDRFLESNLGKECNDILTLESARSQDNFQKYLTNRLKTAFETGWNFHCCYGGKQENVTEISYDEATIN